MGKGRIFFEFRPVGRQVKVSAIDEVTGLEVSIIAPASARRSDMEQLALAKLQRAISKFESK